MITTGPGRASPGTSKGVSGTAIETPEGASDPGSNPDPAQYSKIPVGSRSDSATLHEARASANALAEQAANGPPDEVLGPARMDLGVRQLDLVDASAKESGAVPAPLGEDDVDVGQRDRQHQTWEPGA